MAITSEQKKALEAAGYVVKGNSVMNKSGGSVGGYNENGKIWSGSGKVRDILKSSPAPKAENKPTSRPTKATEKPVTKDALKGYRAGDVTSSRIPTKTGGRGDGGVEVVRRAADRALANAKPKKEKRVPGRALLRALMGGGNPKNYMDQAAGMAKGGMVKKSVSSSKPAKTHKK